MKPPVSQAGSRATSPAGGGTTPKAKAGAKAKAAAGRNPSYCFKFAQPGGCNDKNCSYMHMDEARLRSSRGLVMLSGRTTTPNRDLDLRRWRRLKAVALFVLAPPP